MGINQTLFNQVPYGQSIADTEIIDTLAFFDDWEDRYSYIIDLGKRLPELPEALRTDDYLVPGCQSQVWLIVEMYDDKEQGCCLRFLADSDAFIVRGLIAIVLAALNGKRAEEIVAYDMEAYLDGLALLRHLSQTRGNGLRAFISKIKAIAGANIR